jgi:hypothetical protein
MVVELNLDKVQLTGWNSNKQNLQSNFHSYYICKRKIKLLLLTEL